MCTHWTDMTSLDESCHRVTSYCQCRWANIKACNTTNMRHRHKIKSDTNVESFVILILLKIVRMCRPISPNNSMPMNKICSRFIHLLGCFFFFFTTYSTIFHLNHCGCRKPVCVPGETHDNPHSAARRSNVQPQKKSGWSFTRYEKVIYCKWEDLGTAYIYTKI